MKTLLAGVAIAVAVASPAQSQTIPQYQSPNAQAIANGRDVYDTRGRYVGSDPDPFIRDTMARSNSKD